MTGKSHLTKLVKAPHIAPVKTPKIVAPKLAKPIKDPSTYSKPKSPIALAPGAYLGRKLGKAIESSSYEKYNPATHWLGK